MSAPASSMSEIIDDEVMRAEGGYVGCLRQAHHQLGHGLFGHPSVKDAPALEAGFDHSPRGREHPVRRCWGMLFRQPGADGGHVGMVESVEGEAQLTGGGVDHGGDGAQGGAHGSTGARCQAGQVYGHRVVVDGYACGRWGEGCGRGGREASGYPRSFLSAWAIPFMLPTDAVHKISDTGRFRGASRRSSRGARRRDRPDDLRARADQTVQARRGRSFLRRHPSCTHVARDPATDGLGLSDFGWTDPNVAFSTACAAKHWVSGAGA